MPGQFHPVNFRFVYLLKIFKPVQASLWVIQILKFCKTRQKYAKALEHDKFKAAHILTHNVAHILALSLFPFLISEFFYSLYCFSFGISWK